jgi:hypothetical protein
VATSDDSESAPGAGQAPVRGGRVLLYLYSTRNIVGLALGLVGLALFFAGVIGALWPLVVVALYLIGVLVAPGRRAYDLQDVFDAKDVRKALDTLLRRIHGRVPTDVEAKVQGIARTIEGILPRAGQLSGGSEQLFILERTATEYLPTSLESYLNLPRVYATVQPVKGGKTAKQLLVEQLDLLQQQMDEVADAVAKSDVNRLLAQGRFLEERFARRPDLSLGPSEPEQPSGPTQAT